MNTHNDMRVTMSTEELMNEVATLRKEVQNLTLAVTHAELTKQKVQAEIDAIYISQKVVTPEEVRASRFPGLHPERF